MSDKKQDPFRLLERAPAKGMEIDGKVYVVVPESGRLRYLGPIDKLGKDLEEDTMEKYGVETKKTKEELDKEAGDKATCPSCGRELLKDTNVPFCVSCGTEPFEKKEEDK